MNRSVRRSGFTLIEMAVVLVIIGLIVGGILTGRSLVRQSEINSFKTQANSIQTAMATFRDKYGSVPGELLNYKTFFPQLVGLYCPGNMVSGSVFDAGSNIDGIVNDTYEWEAAYAQLYAAGLVPNGRAQILSDGTVRPAWDCLANSMLQKAAFTTKLEAVFATWSTANAMQALSYGDATHPVLNVAEALQFDLKFDDGIASGGNIIGFRTATAGYCTTSATPPYTYDLAYSKYLTCYIKILVR